MHRIAAETLPAALYRDPSLYETERRHIFARSWQLVAHEAQFPEPGDWLALTLAGYPLIVVRGNDDNIRCFHNVCRHRAGPLAPEGQGRCDGALVCRYHGWRYALDGRLASARDFGPAADFDPRDYGLIGVSCENWRGFLFVNIDQNAAPLASVIARLAERLRHMPLESFRPVRHTSHEIRCNWKTYVENYLEGYHVPVVHPSLCAAIDSSRYEIEIHGEIVFHYAPPREGAAISGLWGWMWPCLGINGYANGVMMERMWPLDFARTRLDYLYFFPPDLPETEMQAAVEASEVTTVEDIAITEAVQRNLDAGIYDRGRLSPKHEDCVALFQQLYTRGTHTSGQICHQEHKEHKEV
ncbi:MAG TPA: aromatic ring-hydroxylating dioxygenase subunit alpha [Rhizomicrobium sp.]|jgi:choline monooxygenase|nr:aromatic ring-hydroxylating dioxygenase subunit alpha [Rhizomicrobium sp.]